jgi:branched-chain amino acid transport system substrate-binding protein
LIFFCILIPEIPAEEPVRIEASLSFSGVYREPSHMIMKGYRLWEKNINERGGLLGRPVELIILDDQSDEEKLRENYRRLLDDEKVDLVLAPYSSPLTLAASEITEEAGYVMVASGAASSAI